MRLVVDGLEGIGIPALKGRDHREPGWRQKQDYEEKLMSVIVRHFGRQRRKIREKLEMYYPMRKLPDIPLDDLLEDEDALAEFIRLLQAALRDGISLFAAGDIPQIDWTLTNKRAVEWARKYTYEFIKDLDDITRKVLQDAVGQFVETTGMTIADVMDLLPFNEERAQRIAVTEITRVYSKANQLAGDDLKKEFPDVRIIDTFFTNNDDRVCDICSPLDGKEVEHGELFYEPQNGYQDGYEPLHPECRCWHETSTKID